MSQTRQAGRCNVALVISNLEFGGAQRQLIELANNLSGDRFDVYVYSLSNYVPLAQLLKLNASRFWVVEKKSKYDLSVVFRLAALFREHDISLAHAFLFDAEIATRLACAISPVSVMIGSERNSNYVVKINQKIAYRATKSLRNLCIANSHSGARFNSKVLGYPDSHYRVVHNCVDTVRFFPREKSQARRRLGLRDRDFVIGMFASIKPQKNHEMLLKAVQQNSVLRNNVKILFVGDVLHMGAQDTVSYSDKIRQMALDFSLGEICEFLGNREDLEFIYPACDITVLPSHFEGLPNVVLESFASGVPPIVTDVSDNAIIVDDGVDGFVVQPNDIEALSANISRLYMDKILREKMSVRVRTKAESMFSPHEFAERVSGIYLEMIHGKSNLQ